MDRMEGEDELGRAGGKMDRMKGEDKLGRWRDK